MIDARRRSCANRSGGQRMYQRRMRMRPGRVVRHDAAFRLHSRMTNTMAQLRAVLNSQ